jgi:hypothetical protein
MSEIVHCLICGKETHYCKCPTNYELLNIQWFKVELKKTNYGNHQP